MGDYMQLKFRLGTFLSIEVARKVDACFFIIFALNLERQPKFGFGLIRIEKIPSSMLK